MNSYIYYKYNRFVINILKNKHYIQQKKTTERNKIKMRKFLIFILLSQYLLSSVTSKDTLEDMSIKRGFGDDNQFMKGLNQSLSRIRSIAENMVNKLKSPRNFKARYVCLWKICSRPLKKHVTKITTNVIRFSQENRHRIQSVFFRNYENFKN